MMAVLEGLLGRARGDKKCPVCGGDNIVVKVKRFESLHGDRFEMARRWACRNETCVRYAADRE